MDNKIQLDRKTIEAILDKISRMMPIIKPSATYDKRQWTYFNTNMKNYMLNVALYIFYEKDVLNVAYDLMKMHIPDMMTFEKLSSSFLDICIRIVVLRSNVESLAKLREVQVINYIFCELYCDLNERPMEEVLDLPKWFEFTRIQVENLIAKEIQENL